ncbi:5024_t:CDS:1, partial [Paraglomus occultum]
LMNCSQPSNVAVRYGIILINTPTPELPSEAAGATVIPARDVHTDNYW